MRRRRGNGPSARTPSNDPQDRKHDERAQPRHAALAHADHGRSRAGADLAPDGRDGGDAGRIQKREHEEADRRRCGQERRDARSAEQNLKRGDDGFLGDEAGDQRRCAAPVRKAERREDGRDQPPDHGKQAVAAGGDDVQPRVKALEESDGDGGKENDRKGALKEILCLFPQQLTHIL